MSGYIDDSVIERVQAENDILEIIGEYVKLKRTGNNYVGLCPFHHEKTPSFSVNPDKRFYHCFGCGEGGDIIKFVMKMENMDFIEAVTYLGQKIGLEIETSEVKRNEETEKQKELYHRINKLAARFFHESLKSDARGREYLFYRGISPEMIQRFGIGYADAGWTTLCSYLQREGFDNADLIKLGLIAKNKSGDSHYDVFRDRIIFPIIDIKAQVIGFGGRILGEGHPKYLNSPENLIFSKGNHLFGLNLVKKYSDKSHIILVEGYTDVIAMFQNHIPYAVASLGTAFTENQAKLMKRFGENIYIAYDSDSAGVKAANRTIDVLLNQGVSPKVIRFGNYKDPDEFFKEHSVEDFKDLMDDAQTHYEYRMDYLKTKYRQDDSAQIAQLVREMTGYIENIKSPVEREVYLTKLSKDMNISRESISSEMRQQHRPQQLRIRSAKKRLSREEQNAVKELEILKLLIYDIKYYNDLSIILSNYVFKNADYGKLYSTISAFYQAGKKLDKEALWNEMSSMSEMDARSLHRVIYSDEGFFVNDPEEMVKEIKESFLLLDIQERRAAIIASIQELESRENWNEQEKEKMEQLLNKLNELNFYRDLIVIEKGR